MNDKSPDEQYSGRYFILFAIMLGSIMGPIDASMENRDSAHFLRPFYQ
jgi:hypothetical protein